MITLVIGEMALEQLDPPSAGKIEPDQRPPDALAGLAIVKITNARASADLLVQEIMQRTGSFLKSRGAEKRERRADLLAMKWL